MCLPLALLLPLVLSPLCHGGRSLRHGCESSEGRRRGRPGRISTAVVLHMRADEMAGSESTAQGQLTSEDGGGDNTGETARVVTRARRVSAADAEEVEHGGLGLEDGAAAESTDFERGHRHGDLEGAAEAGGKTLVIQQNTQA